jgi:ribonuclease I
MVPECVPKKADRMDNQRKHNSFQFDEFWGLFVKLPQRKGKKTINNTGNSAFLPQKNRETASTFDVLCLKLTQGLWRKHGTCSTSQ